MGILLSKCKRHKFSLCCQKMLTACVMGHPHCIRHLYAKYQPIINPLYYSITATNGFLECLQLLFEYDGDNKSNNSFYEYVSQCAWEHKQYEVLIYLYTINCPMSVLVLNQAKKLFNLKIIFMLHPYICKEVINEILKMV